MHCSLIILTMHLPTTPPRSTLCPYHTINLVSSLKQTTKHPIPPGYIPLGMWPSAAACSMSNFPGASLKENYPSLSEQLSIISSSGHSPFYQKQLPLSLGPLVHIVSSPAPTGFMNFTFIFVFQTFDHVMLQLFVSI